MPGSEKLIGQELTNHQKEELQKNSILPLRFWRSADIATISESNRTDWKQSLDEKTTVEEKPNKAWQPQEELDLSAVGLREASSQSDLQGFKPIRGKGCVAANLATLRMVARAYNTPCPVDVLEKVLEGAVERAGSVPIQAMGPRRIHGFANPSRKSEVVNVARLELPVLVGRGHTSH